MSPASSAPLASTASPRERLLAAANELFYLEGVHTVGIDRIIARAGVAKASLYSTFGSKDELVRAYLAARHAYRKQRITERLARYDSPRERLLGLFEVLGELTAESHFRGCAFLRASAEGPPSGAVRGACDDARGWLRGLLTDLSQAAGAAKPRQLAQQLLLLYDGVAVAAQMDQDPKASATARMVAATLLDAATAGAKGSGDRGR